MSSHYQCLYNITLSFIMVKRFSHFKVHSSFFDFLRSMTILTNTIPSNVLYSLLIFILSTSEYVFPALSFTPPTVLFPTRESGISFPRHQSTNYRTTDIPAPSRRRSTNAALPFTSSSTAANAPKSTPEISDELLFLLQSKASAKNNEKSTNDDRINTLVQSLISSQTPFDPNRSIYGPLYATVHFIGETPLWEKISLFGARNVKGQKFIIDSTKEESSVSFANYAEILGGNLYLKAVGIATDIGPVGKQSTFSSRSLPSPLFENPFQNIISSFLFQRDNSVTLLPTPYDYEAKVTGASIVFFSKISNQSHHRRDGHRSRPICRRQFENFCFSGRYGGYEGRGGLGKRRFDRGAG